MIAFEIQSNEVDACRGQQMPDRVKLKNMVARVTDDLSFIENEADEP